MGDSIEITSEMALEADGSATASTWHKHVALTTLVLAAFTAVGALLSGITANSALLERTEEIIELSMLEADLISVELLKAKHEILLSQGESLDPAEIAQIEAFEAEVENLAEHTEADEARISVDTQAHLIFAIMVTLLSVAITLCGMAIIVDLKMLWYGGIVFGIVGAVGVAWGILQMA